MSFPPLPPRSKGLPLLGETLAYVRAPRTFVQQKNAQFGPVFRSNVFFSPTIFLTGTEAVAWVLAGENKYLQGKWIKPVERLLGRSSSTMLTGEEHLERRRLLAPVFSYASLRPFVPRIQAIAKKHFNKQVGQTFDIIELFRDITFEVIAKLTIDEEQLDLDFLSNRFHDWTAGMFSPLPIKHRLFPFGRALHARSEILAYLTAFIHARKGMQTPPDDLLTRLIEARQEDGQPLSEDAIANEIILQLFAGHETSVTSLSNLSLLLHQHPEVWQHLSESLVDQPAQPVLKDFRKMSYLTWTIQESMRLIPPVAGGFREMTEDAVYQGMHIPKGYTVIYNAHSVHHGSDWEDSDRFDPLRFSPEARAKTPQRKSFIPFGGGARACTGQHLAMVEMSVVLFELVRGYQWELVEGQDLTYQYIPFPLPKKGIKVRFTSKTSTTAKKNKKHSLA